jgi:hypothetical protein
MGDPSEGIVGSILVIEVELRVNEIVERLITYSRLTKCGDLGFPSSGLELERCKGGNGATQTVPNQCHLIVGVFCQSILDVRDDRATRVAPGGHKAGMYSAILTFRARTIRPLALVVQNLRRDASVYMDNTIGGAEVVVSTVTRKW